MLSAWWQPTVSGKGSAYGEPVILAKSQRDAVVRRPGRRAVIRKDLRHGRRESSGIMKAGAWPAGPPWPQPAAVSSISSASPRVRLGSTWIPGLMVLVRMIFLR
jgi:hypothetical protein